MSEPPQQEYKEPSRIWYWSIPLFLVFEISRRLGYLGYATGILILVTVLVILANLVRSWIQKHRPKLEKKVEPHASSQPQDKAAVTVQQNGSREFARRLFFTWQGRTLLLALFCGIAFVALALHYRGPKYTVCKGQTCDQALEVSDPLKYCVDYLRVDGYRAQQCGRDVQVFVNH